VHTNLLLVLMQGEDLRANSLLEFRTILPHFPKRNRESLRVFNVRLSIHFQMSICVMKILLLQSKLNYNRNIAVYTFFISESNQKH
jgi:hypothetical protein